MSTLRVNTLQNTSTTDGGISIDTSGHVTVDGVAMPSSGPLSNRNLVINGAMQVAQRGTAAVTTSGAFPVDRFKTSYNVTGGAFTAQQSTDAPEGFKNSTKFEVTTAASAGASEVCSYFYAIEGQDMQQADFGLSSAKSLTASFWVRSSLTGTYSVAMRNNDGSRSYIAEYTVSSANTWEKKTVTFPGTTDGTWATDNTVGASLTWDLGSGSDRQGTAGSWLVGTNDFASSNNVNWCNTSSATWYITGVQLEVGSVATPFEHRSFGDELARCQRYFCKNGSDSFVTLMAQSAIDNITKSNSTEFPVTMRAQPGTITLYDIAGTSGQIHYQTRGGGGSNIAGSIYESSTTHFSVRKTAAANEEAQMIFRYEASAEL